MVYSGAVVRLKASFCNLIRSAVGKKDSFVEICSDLGFCGKKYRLIKGSDTGRNFLKGMLIKFLTLPSALLFSHCAKA